MLLGQQSYPQLDMEQEQRTIPQQIVYLFKYSQTEFTRFSSALCMAGWSLTLLWPGETIGATTQFWYLQWANDLFWSIATMTLAAVLAASAHWQWRKTHAAALGVAMTWWLFLCLSILITCIVRDLPAATGIPTYGTFAVGAIWAFLRYMARHDVVQRPGE